MTYFNSTGMYVIVLTIFSSETTSLNLGTLRKQSCFFFNVKMNDNELGKQH